MRDSSKLSHEAIKPKKDKHRSIILQTMRKIGKPCTSREISNYPDHKLDRVETARRMSEMRELGEIREVVIAEDRRFKPVLWDLNE
jgi:hypothetical protein